MLNERIASNIRRVRLAKGWSLKRVAERCEPATTYQTIGRLEMGERKLTLEWVERISKALGIDASQLVAENDPNVTPPVETVLNEQVANEVAHVLGRVALDGAEPSPGTLEVLSLMLRELSDTFARHPEVRQNATAARPVVQLLARRHASSAS